MTVVKRIGEYLAVAIGFVLFYTVVPVLNWRCNKGKHFYWKDSPVNKKQEYCTTCWTVREKADGSS